MNVESNRLNTFTNWPSSAPVDSVRIARAGFFYTGNGTEVECFSCGGKISEWNYGDQVMWRHRLLQPNCSFVLTPQLSGNVPSIVGQVCVTTTGGANVTETFEDRSYTNDDGYGLSADDQLYKSDALRLLSFLNWNDSSVSRESLVNAGFYHAGSGRLRCAWCGGELAPFRNFGSLGSPIEVHRMYFPRCEYALQMERRDNNSSNTSSPIDMSYTPPTANDYTPQTSGAVQNEQVVAAGSTWRDLGVVSGGAKHPSKAALATRLATFDRWPYDRPQAPHSLAEAGFFYTGVEDQVRCFYCDGGLGKWEAGDVPWREHAGWFPQCGYVLTIKGQEFVDAAQHTNNAPTVANRTIASDRSSNGRARNPPANFPLNENQVELCMESTAALAALGAGLDAARVRRAIVRRLRATGTPFITSESLIDAVLDEQLNEESWSVPQSQRFARDILAETLRAFGPRTGILPAGSEDRYDSAVSSSDTAPQQLPTEPRSSQSIQVYKASVSDKKPERTQEAANKVAVTENNKMTLEEENRQLKEARLCKVCMDNEVSIVFLPCGHLVSCAECSTALAACPLCRAAVKALVRAYFA